MLSGDVVVLVRNAGPALLQRGQVEPRPICAPTSTIGTPPFADSVDCIDVVEKRGRIGAARIDWKRLSTTGAVTAQASLSVDDDRHVLLARDFF